MRVVGLITEYNPFHSGHLYHMNQAKEITGADAAVIVMSGNFVQRGLPALVNKYARTRMALAAGADCVIELPVRYATGSAEVFAVGALHILESLGCVTDLVFGSEEEKPEVLSAIAVLLAEEPDSYKALLQEGLRRGLSYPAARSQAASRFIPDADRYLASPNNILSIEYQKAILRLHSSIRPHSIQRTGIGYHQSATKIREACALGTLEDLASYLPDFTRKELSHPLFADDFSSLLQYRLRMLSSREISEHMDISQELASRIKTKTGRTASFFEAVESIKTKNQTQTHIQRALIHLLLGIKKEEQPLAALRLLGLNKNSPVLRELKQHTTLPLVTKLADAPSDAFREDVLAADIYNLAYYNRYGESLPDEYHAGPVLFA